VFIQEIRRVLKRGGIFMLSTPNKKLRLLPLQKPRNIEHQKEYDYKEMRKLLKKFFKQIKITGLFATKLLI
jgi:ubiquinone/menaquinone biosynthesis C-methylase UbiE